MLILYLFLLSFAGFDQKNLFACLLLKSVGVQGMLTSFSSRLFPLSDSSRFLYKPYFSPEPSVKLRAASRVIVITFVTIIVGQRLVTWCYDGCLFPRLMAHMDWSWRVAATGQQPQMMEHWTLHWGCGRGGKGREGNRWNQPITDQ